MQAKNNIDSETTIESTSTSKQLSSLIEKRVEDRCTKLKVRQHVLSEVHNQLQSLNDGLFQSVIRKFAANNKDHAVFCAYNENGEIIGYAIIWEFQFQSKTLKKIYLAPFELAAIWVDEKHRCRKPDTNAALENVGELSIAHILRERCITFAASKGRSHVFLQNVAKDLQKAETSHIRRGFKVYREEKEQRHQFGQQLAWFVLYLKEDVLFMVKQLQKIYHAFGRDVNMAINDLVELYPDSEVDIRNAIVDGRMLQRFVSKHGNPKVRLFCFGRQNDHDLGLKGVMNDHEIEDWINRFPIDSFPFQQESNKKREIHSRSKLFAHSDCVLVLNEEWSMQEFFGQFANDASTIFHEQIGLFERSGCFIRKSDMLRLMKQFQVHQ